MPLGKNFISLMVACFIGLTGCAPKSVLTEQLSVRTNAEKLSDGDVAIVNENSPGERVDLARHVVLGKYTVFEFTSET